MKMNIRNKLLVSFTVVLLLMGVVGFVGYNSASRLGTIINTLYVNQTLSISSIKQANIDFYNIRVAIRQITLETDAEAIQTDLKKISTMDIKVRADLADFEKRITSQKVQDGYTALSKSYESYMSEVNTKILPLAKDPDKKSETITAIKNAAPIANQMDQAITDLVAIEEQQAAEFYAQSNDTISSSSALIIGIGILAVLFGWGIAVYLARSMSKAARLMANTADQIAQVDLPELAFVASALAAGDMTRSITLQAQAPAYHSQDEMGDLAKSFSAMISRLYETGSAFTQMTNNLRVMVGQVTDNANDLSSASQQLAASANQTGQVTNQIALTIQQISVGIGQQSNSIGNTAVSVRQMGEVIDDVAKGALDQSTAVVQATSVTSQLSEIIHHVTMMANVQVKGADEAVRATRASTQIVENTVEGMEAIKSRVNLSSEKVKEMGKRSEEIGAIVATIEDIASQTNLLALNAAIEAARAGMHGKGFSVVADEVRKLAEKSTAATKQISGLILGIQKTVDEAVQAMDESTNEVDKGVALAGESSHSLEVILDAAMGGKEIGDDISLASGKMEQLAGDLVDAMDKVSVVVEKNTTSAGQMLSNSNQVTITMETIASVSEENSASVEEVSSGAEELNSQVEEVNASAQSLSEMANELMQVVGRFKLERTVVINPGNKEALITSTQADSAPRVIQPVLLSQVLGSAAK